MAEYIDIDAQVVVTDTRGRERETTVRHIFEMNKGVYTAADVRPVVKAKWDYTDMSRLVCSNCGNPVAFSLKEDGWHHGDYCPNCGARMDGDDDS